MFCGSDRAGAAGYCENCIDRALKEDKCWKCGTIFKRYVMSHGMCEECNRSAIRSVKFFVYGDPDYNPFIH